MTYASPTCRSRKAVVIVSGGSCLSRTCLRLYDANTLHHDAALYRSHVSFSGILLDTAVVFLRLHLPDPHSNSNGMNLSSVMGCC